MQTPQLLSDPAYHDEEAARASIEAIRMVRSVPSAVRSKP
jgi:hypothetical protein